MTDELEIKDTTESDKSASYLDILLKGARSAIEENIDINRIKYPIYLS
jgi:hypothetical protein